MTSRIYEWDMPREKLFKKRRRKIDFGQNTNAVFFPTGSF